jgi:hypothetical protein
VELFGEHWPADAPLGGHQSRLRALDRQLSCASILLLVA